MSLEVKRDAPNSQLPLLPALQSEALSARSSLPPSLLPSSLCGLTTTCARRRGGGGAAVAVAVRWCVACHWPVATRPPLLPSFMLFDVDGGGAPEPGRRWYRCVCNFVGQRFRAGVVMLVERGSLCLKDAHIHRLMECTWDLKFTKGEVYLVLPCKRSASCRPCQGFTRRTLMIGHGVAKKCEALMFLMLQCSDRSRNP